MTNIEFDINYYVNPYRFFATWVKILNAKVTIEKELNKTKYSRLPRKLKKKLKKYRLSGIEVKYV